MSKKMSVENNNTQELRSGVPSIKNVEVVEKLESFLTVQKYSKSYLLNNKSALKEYRWIKDSLNQWSRIYEYPYCFEALKNNISDGAHVLDAGSGITFFPFFLDSFYKMTCIDQDDYSNIYNQINDKQKTSVNFKTSDLQNISFPDETFDAIYCISVLEHTEDYDKILNEFHRILKPSGIMVITFDVSMGTDTLGLNRESSINLIDTIEKHFSLEYKSANLIHELDKADVYTTKYVQKFKSQKLLPWPTSTIKRIIIDLFHGQKITLSVNLTFCNIVAKKM